MYRFSNCVDCEMARTTQMMNQTTTTPTVRGSENNNSNNGPMPDSSRSIYEVTLKVLIVGVEGTGKHRLGEAMQNVQLPSGFRLEVRTAAHCLIGDGSQNQVFDVNLVVALVKLTQKHSIDIMDSLPSILPIQYFFDKICVVATEYSNTELLHIQIDEIEKKMCYSIPLHFGNTEDPDKVRHLAYQMVELTQLLSGSKPCLRSLLFKSWQH